jgi:protein-disulfide isomerase
MPLDHVVPGVDPTISRLIDRCLAKLPAERPGNAQALLDELRTALKPNSLPAARPSLRSRASQPLASTTQAEPLTTLVRPSERTRQVTQATHLLVASGVVCSLGALALPLAGLAAPGTALLCAAVGGGLLLGASSHIKTLRALLEAPKNDNAVPRPAPSTIVLSERPKRLLHPMRGRPEAPVRIELFADLTCAITRRSCQRVMSLRVEHPDDISVVYKPYWDPQRELAPVAAEFARALFEREGAETFWAFFDRMLNNTRRVTLDLLYEHAAQVCPDMHGLRRALRTHVHRKSLLQCRDEAESMGVDQSPSLRINGTLLPGEPSEDRLRWAYVDAMTGVEQRRKVELGETRVEEIPLDKLTAVRGLLVRYRGARNAPAGLSRTREEALDRARKLRSRAGMQGADFADVALRFADALLEPEVLASRLNDPNLGEVVIRLRIGDMSEPLPCDEGFQVLQRIG